MRTFHTLPSRRHAIAIAASLLCSVTSLAHGQATAPAAASSTAQPADEDQRIEKVIVTAQKREQAAIDVPASVSTLSADRLQRSGAVRLEDYAAQVPGMSITALSRGFSSVVLRGISTGISAATPATGYYIDEAPIGSVTAYASGNTLTPDIDPYDLRRIEVLTGPQGTLYGAGAIGGLLRYVTVDPDSKRFGGAVSLGGNKIAGGGTGGEARAAVNIPLVEGSMALRVSALARDDAGFIDNPAKGKSDVNEAHTRGGRVAFGWKMNEDWSLLASAQTQRFRSGGLGVVDMNGPALAPVRGDLEHNAQTDETQKTGLDVFNATIKGSAGGLDLVSSTTYQKITSDVIVDSSATLGAVFSAVLRIPGIGARTHQAIDTKRWSQELRARGSALDDRLEYEAGYYFTQEKSSNDLIPEPLFLTSTGAPLAFGNVFDAGLGVKYTEHSVFSNINYALTPKLELMAGLRYSRNKQSFSQDYQASLALPRAIVFDEKVSDNTTTYLLSTRYKPDAATAFYARIATGYRPGGPSGLPASIGKPSYEADSLTSYEVGYKADLASGLASVEAAVFSTDWKDVQVQTQTVSGGSTYQNFVNGGKARSQGIEATLLLFPVKGLTLRSTAGYTNSKLTENAPAIGGVDGDRMPFVPRYTASIGADYRFPLGSMKAWVGATAGYIGERRSNFSQKLNALDVPSYTTLGLNAGADIGNARISLYGKNLADKRGINFANTIGLASAANPAGNPYAVGVIQPRTIGIDLAYRF
jgi:iron complex outermembrane receptor protein